MRVTTKGQITIPQEIRQRANILPGTEVEFVIEKDRIILRKKPNAHPSDAVIKNMIGKGNLKMTTDEILALTRGDR